MSRMARIPADVDREDQIMVGLTARQVAVLAVTAMLGYGAWQLTRGLVPTVVFLVVAVPIVVAVAALVILRRDGMSLDRLLLAAVTQRLRPRRRVAAGTATSAQPPAWVASGAQYVDHGPVGEYSLPAERVDEAGVVDLGAEGLAVVADCSTVNFALRTPDEQDALTSAFGRYLHSLGAPVQIVVRTVRLELGDQVHELRSRAAGLPHPALEEAAWAHADDLEQLAATSDLLRRQVLLVLREPHASPQQARKPRNQAAGEPTQTAQRAAAGRLARRLREASELLAAAGVVVTPLDTTAATTVLTSATQPTAPPHNEHMASADEVISVVAGDEANDLEGDAY